MKVKKVVYSLKGALRYENITLKLTVGAYASEQDFKHLTNKDKSIIKEFPKTLKKQDLTNLYDMRIEN